jgi:capsid protein
MKEHDNQKPPVETIHVRWADVLSPKNGGHYEVEVQGKWRSIKQETIKKHLSGGRIVRWN